MSLCGAAECDEYGCPGDCRDEWPCQFCGDPDCDKSGYNCGDGHYQEYNLRGWPDQVEGTQ